MLSWFRTDPKKALQKRYDAKLQEAHDAMHKQADLLRYAALMEEAEGLADKLEALEEDA